MTVPSSGQAEREDHQQAVASTCCDRQHGALPAAVLFDLDDTILATSESQRRSWQTVCNQFSARLDGYAPTAVYRAIKEYQEWFESDRERARLERLGFVDGKRTAIRGALERLGLHEGAAALADEMAVAYGPLREQHSALFPGAVETLQRLGDHGLRLALLTNSIGAIQRLKVARHALEQFFDCIIIEGEFGQGKPHESVYRHALAELGVRPDEAWMVGDNLENDVAAPQRIGIFGIWVDVWGTGLPAESSVHPDRIIRTIAMLV